jgi:hypothetical protein
MLVELVGADDPAERVPAVRHRLQPVDQNRLVSKRISAP